MLDLSREFIELAIFENVTAAAKRLHLSASTLSRHLSELEQELGFKLFERSPMRLTAAGRYYLENISGVIDTIDEIVAQGRSIAQAKHESFTIYMIQNRADWGNSIYEAISSLRRLHPGIDVNVCTDDRHFTVDEALKAEKADAAVMFEGSLLSEAAFDFEMLAEDELCAWVTRENPLSGRTALEPEDLAGLSLPISTNRQSLVGTRAVLELLQRYDVKLGTHMRNINDRSGFFMLRSDEVMLDYALDDEPLRINPDLVKLPFSAPLVMRVYLATRKGDPNPVTQDFVSICRQITASGL